MDETLQSIEWSSYHHAYGPAEDTPEAIASLKSADPVVRENALNHLAVTIYHQGDLYSATAPAVTALIRLTANEQTPDRPDILGLVEAIAESAARLRGTFASDDLLDDKTRAERGFREVLLPVQVAFASQRATLESLLGDPNKIVTSIAESILDIIREFPYPNFYDPVYRGLEGTEYGTVTAFTAAYPTMTFGQLASRLGKRISAQHVWGALLTEAQASGRIEALARSTLVREIREQTRERGWGISLHFGRICERIKSNWFLRFSPYRDQCEAVWTLLVSRAEKGWLPQHPDEPIIRECFAVGWQAHNEGED